jgi:uncharacterized phosphosugar-binding protein
MSTSNEANGIGKFFSAISDLQSKVFETQFETMTLVAKKMADVVEKDGRIFVFGTGHSHIMAEEAFFRAGGLVAVVPIFMTNFMLHEHVFLSSKLERTAGIAGPLLDEYKPKEGEMLFIYSNSGVNQVPVEMALEAKKRGLITVAVCSVEYAKVAPISSLGKRLFEVADHTIDNCGRPGDALVQLEDTPLYVAPSSTIIGALIWNSLITEALSRLHSTVDLLPLAVSYNVEGSVEHNRQVLEKWSKVNPHLSTGL